jgi:nicotinate phosphoribosyltransferase
VHEPPSALLTDLYELTMLRGYHRLGMHRRDTCFEMFFRRPPFNGGFAVAAGLEDALRFLQQLHFAEDDLAYLAGLELFDDEFLDHLRAFRFTGDIYAIPEGEIVFPGEPLLRVHGALEECQFIETALLTIVNFQTLVATKAARVCGAAGGDNVLEFGLRRAQGPDGGLSASRAAYLGGCGSTSDVEAGRLWGIPVRGTHAHSWVLAFPNELDAFRAFAEVYPRNCILLVDTFDTLRSGVPNAIRVGREMKARGCHLLAIRLDSGDSAGLAIESRRMLDQAGLTEVKILCSGDLDEYAIQELKSKKAPIDMFGVGTRLVTAHDDPSLTGVYKMAAMRGADGAWSATMKLSDEDAKATLPGVKQVWREFEGGGMMVRDVVELTDTNDYLPPAPTADPNPQTPNPKPLLTRVMARGSVTTPFPPLVELRARCLSNLERLPAEVRRLSDPARYDVALGPRLQAESQRLRELNRPS